MDSLTTIEETHHGLAAVLEENSGLAISAMTESVVFSNQGARDSLAKNLFQEISE